MADDRAPPAAPQLQPARMALLTRRLATGAGVAALLAAFLAAVVTLPTAAALAVGAALAVVGLWLARRLSRATQAGLVATGDGVVVRMGTASAEIAWRAIEAITATGPGRRVAIEVRADQLRRQLPAVFDAADARRWLGAAAELAGQAGRDDLQLADDALTTAPGSREP